MPTARQAQGATAQQTDTERCQTPAVPAIPAHVCCCTPLIPVATTASTYLPHMRCGVCGAIYGIDGNEKFPCENPRRHCDPSDVARAQERWAR